jgi:hypothetical protein
MVRNGVVAVVLLLCAGTAWGFLLPQTKPGEDKILARFVGKWEIEGKHMKAPMKGSAEYSWALGKKFLKGDGRIVSGDGSFAYESTIYIRPTEKEGQYSIVWLDNMGNIINSTMVSDGKKLTMEWMEKTPLGDHPAKSEINLLDEGWTDTSFGKIKDTWVEFGTVTFKRK